MANRALIVEIIGDDRKLQQAFARSTAAAKQFSTNIGRSLSSGVSVQKSFDPLLSDVSRMKGEADALTGRLNKMGDGFAGANRGAGVLNAGLIGVLGRATAFGFAVSTAYQASQRLTEALEQTGQQAFTTEGRLRNMGAALIQGDLLGAFSALRAQPKTLEELGISAVEARNRLDALQLVASGAAQRLRESGESADGNSDSLKRYSEIVDKAGTSNRELARQLVQLVAGMDAAENAQDSLADSTARLGSVFRDVTGQAVTFKGAVDDIGGPRGPGLVDQINANLEANRFPKFPTPQKPIGPTAKNAAAQVIAQAQGDLPELLRLQIIERDRLQKAFENSRGNVKQREALNQSLSSATAAVIGTQKQIASQAAAAKATADAAEAQKLSTHWQRVIGALQIGVDRAELTSQLSDDLSKLNVLKAGLERQIKAGVDVQTAQRQLVVVTGDIATKQKQIQERAQAALQARQFRALGLSPTGDQRVPGVENLRKQFESLSKRVVGEGLSSKLVSQLRAAGKVLGGEFGKVTEETRRRIVELFSTIRGEIEKGSTGPLTASSSLNANRILEGLGLTRDMEKELRARLSGFNSAGLSLPGRATATTGGFAAAPVVVESHTTVTLDGDVVGRTVTRSQQKAVRRNPPQRRGPNAR